MKTLLAFLIACILCAMMFHSNEVEAKDGVLKRAAPAASAGKKVVSKKAPASKKDFGPDDWYACIVTSQTHQYSASCWLGKSFRGKFKAVEDKKLSARDAEKVLDIGVALDKIFGDQFPEGINECTILLHPTMPNLSPPGSAAIVIAIGVEMFSDEDCPNFDQTSLVEMRDIVGSVYWTDQRYSAIVEEKEKKEAAEQKAKGPFVMVLDNDMSAIQLADYLDSKNLKGVHFFDNTGVKRDQEQDNNCWRGDVPEGVRVAKFEAAGLRSPDEIRWPVIWHGFRFDRSVFAARVKDKYTGKMADEARAHWSLGGADRWNPYLCKRGDDDRVYQPTSRGLGQDYFPEFKKGDGLYVIPK